VGNAHLLLVKFRAIFLMKYEINHSICNAHLLLVKFRTMLTTSTLEETWALLILSKHGKMPV